MLANIANTDLTNIRFYIDDTSYYEPCRTTGYFSPTNSTGIDTILSWVNIIGYSIRADKADLVKVDFTAKVSGVMVLI